MNLAHIHLILNHFPVIGMLFAFIVLVYSQIKHSKEVKKAAFVLFVLVGILAVPVYFSGGEAEEIVEHLPGVSENLIENHEEMAEVAFTMTLITGALAMCGIFIASFARHIVISLFVMSILTGGVLGYTANLGGKIRHQEIRSPFAFAQEGQKAFMNKRNEKEYE